MSSEALAAYYRRRRVGTLTRNRTGVLLFTYDSTWLEAKDAFAISLSQPLVAREYREAAHFFFSNLLPEGSIRRAVTRRLGISEANDFELLRAIGGECAGALTIVEADAGAPEQTHDYEAIDAAQLSRLNATAAALSTFVGDGKARLSLAGAQDKLPIYVKDGRFFLPLGNSPSSHILELENRDYERLPANEVFVTMLAKALGLPAPPADLVTSTRCARSG